MTTQDRRGAQRFSKGRDERLGFTRVFSKARNKTENRNFIAGIAEVFSAVPSGEVTKETAMKKFDWQAWIDRNGIRVFNRMPQGWKALDGATHSPRGYVCASNGRSLFDAGRESALVRVDAADLTVCKMEGWDHTEYATDLNLLLSDIVEKFRETSRRTL